MEPVVFINGTLLPRSEARVSPSDLGFLYGYALFETMRAYSGRIFRLQRHLDRLKASAAAIGLPLGEYDLEKACCDTLRANGLDEARVRLTVTAGEGEGTPDPPRHGRPTVLAAASAYTPLSRERYRAGFRAVVSRIGQNSRSPLSRLKSANYLNHLLARKEARDAGADEALLLNERGFLCEGSTTNIFLVSEGELVTPSEESGCLPGVTRQAVIEIAADLGTTVRQREVEPEEALRAEEAFLTNSLLQVMPLVSIDGRPIGCGAAKGSAGGTTGRLALAYEDLVLREVSL